MLSILIPTYNYNVFPLALALNNQAKRAHIDFEIICIDDGSLASCNSENEKINTLENSRFIAAQQNVGLSTNRNNLVEASKYDYLLFIDGDSKIIDENFIKNYINHIDETSEIIYGGRVHPCHVKQEEKVLRWKYGKRIEDKTVPTRQQNVYKTLMFNNTLIKRTSFYKILFDPSIKSYGHEDTLFAYQAFTLNLNVSHINNPVEHDDIDLNTVFINKTEAGLVNIFKLYQKNKISSEFVTILSFLMRLKKLKLRTLTKYLFKLTHGMLRKQLTSPSPSLFLFNFYKVGFLCSLNINHKDL